MELFDSTGRGITKSGVLIVTKAFEGLLFTGNLLFSALTTEKVKITIQRHGRNEEVTNGWLLLKDFFLLSAYGDSAIQYDKDGNLSVMCDLTSNGNVPLLDGEEVRIELEGLKTTNDWKLDTSETFVSNTKLFDYEQKIVNADQKQGIFNTDEAHLMVIDAHSSIEEIRFTHFNGAQTTHSLRELQAIARSIDPVAEVKSDGTVGNGFTGRLQFPVSGINIVEINKTPGTAINAFFRREV